MSNGIRAAFVAAIVTAALGSTLTEASARGRRLPLLTQCGPDLAYLCPIHGYFDLTPFTYSLAIYPGCLQRQNVETPNGIRRRLVLVCG